MSTLLDTEVTESFRGLAHTNPIENDRVVRINALQTSAEFTAYPRSTSAMEKKAFNAVQTHTESVSEVSNVVERGT